METNENGVVAYITATRQVDKKHWPKLTPHPEPGIQLHLHVSHTPFALVLQELRVIEGLLSYYGLESIALNYPQIEWIPETEEEKRQLQLFSWHETKKTELNDHQVIPLAFDIIARAFIGARHGLDVEVPLSFFRKARIDIYAHRYIEAIYDLYFFFETLYAEGSFKQKQTIEAFQNSEELTNAIKKVLRDPELFITGDEQMWEEYRSKYDGKTIPEILEKIVKLRGFLHHHTSKRRGIWHPEQHKKYETDALFLHAVACYVAFDLSSHCIFDEQVTAEYQQMFQGIATMSQSGKKKVESSIENVDKAHAEITLTLDMHQAQQSNNP